MAFEPWTADIPQHHYRAPQFFSVLLSSLGYQHWNSVQQPGSNTEAHQQLTRRTRFQPPSSPSITWITWQATTNEAVSKVHAEPSILTRLGLALINVSKAGLPFEEKTNRHLKCTRPSVKERMTAASITISHCSSVISKRRRIFWTTACLLDTWANRY